MPRERVFVCPKCGSLGMTTDRYFMLHRHRCEWCDLAPRWLTEDESAAFRASPEAAEALREAGWLNITLTKGENGYVFASWGGRGKKRGKAQYRPPSPRR